jgi:hypothetical protein
MEFKHIDDVWTYWDNIKLSANARESVAILDKACGEIPSKFGGFEVVNVSTAEEERMLEICNSYWNTNYMDYDYDYHTIFLPEEKTRESMLQ